MQECINYKQLGAKNVQCLTCAHYCQIKPDQVGVCGVRQNVGGKLFLLTYGKAAAAHVDPIEKKPLFHFLPGSTVYSFGTVGCNFCCGNCQNHDISQMFGWKGQAKEYAGVEWGYPLSPEEIVEEALAHECPSIAYTYNEPTISLEYMLDTMKLAKQKGLRNVWVSNGFMSPETIELIVPFLDAINIDIKSFEDKFYRQQCGGKVTRVLENCQQLVQRGIWLEVTTLVIPTLSDQLGMLEQIATFIKEKLGTGVPWHVSAFSGCISWKLKDLPDTPTELVERVHQAGKRAGLQYVYAGNVQRPDLESTYCPQCGEVVIERVGYQVTRYDRSGCCANCGCRIAGVFA
ncbi:AmmeMemoRadiSam system radical SAM enzyme [Patescibacteria group bacterium]|nr:MAG: AmmeMemoRadiSam system radical SAM enzyme [Patescibacteria group bacterium]